MAIYHIVLAKLKPSTTPAQVEKFKTAGEAMVGVIPGLRSFTLGPPLASTAFRSRGWNLGVVAVMDDEATLARYAEHDAHKEIMKMREVIADDMMAYDLVA